MAKLLLHSVAGHYVNSSGCIHISNGDHSATIRPLCIHLPRKREPRLLTTQRSVAEYSVPNPFIPEPLNNTISASHGMNVCDKRAAERQGELQWRQVEVPREHPESTEERE